MTFPTKLLAGLLLLTGSFGAGWYYRGSPDLQKQENATQVVVTDRVTTHKTQPDTGETITIIREKITKREKTSSRAPSPPPAQVRSQWSISVLGQYDPALGRLVPEQVVGGYRLISDLWVNSGADLRDRALLFGLTLEF